MTNVLNVMIDIYKELKDASGMAIFVKKCNDLLWDNVSTKYIKRVIDILSDKLEVVDSPIYLTLQRHNNEKKII